MCFCIRATEKKRSLGLPTPTARESGTPGSPVAAVNFSQPDSKWSANDVGFPWLQEPLVEEWSLDYMGVLIMI